MTRKATLTSKRRRTSVFRFEVADPTGPQQALLAAQVELRRAGEDGQAAAQAAVEAAQSALDECFDSVTLRALSPTLQQAFQHEQAAADEAHTAALEEWTRATAEAAEDGTEPPPRPTDPVSTWTEDSFEVRLIAACDADGHTAQEWAEAFDDSDPDNPSDWTLQDRLELLDRCATVNTPRGTYDLGFLGKG